MLSYRRAATVLGLCAGLAACGTSPESNYYLLTPSSGTPPAGTGEGLPGGGVMIVDEATVAPYLDRTQMVRRLDEWRVGVDEFEVWAEPIGDVVTAHLVDALGARYGGDSVMTATSARGLVADFRAGTDLLRFDVDAANRVTLDARWIVFAERGDCEPVTRRYAASTQLPVEAAVPERVAAMSALLDGLAAEIAQGVGSLGGRGCA